MATAESVKAKLQALIANANATTGKTDTTLTNAVRTLIEGYGQGGSGIIYVDALPTENIDEDAVYALTGDSLDYCIILADEETGEIDQDYIKETAASTGVDLRYHVADTLPSEPEVSTGEVMHLYVVKDSGLPHLSYGDVPQLIFNAEMLAYFHGKISKSELEALDFTDENNQGIYLVTDTYFPNLYVYRDGSWEPHFPQETVDTMIDGSVNTAVNNTINSMDRIIDVDELPTESIKENCIYRVPTPAVEGYWVEEGVTASSGVEGIAPLGDAVALFFAIGGIQGVTKARYILVSELPETGIANVKDRAYIYVTESDGIPYLYWDGVFTSLIEVFAGLQGHYYVDYLPTASDAEGVYICKTTEYKYFKFVGNAFVELSNADDVKDEYAEMAREIYLNLIDKTIVTVDTGDTLKSVGAFAFAMCHDLQTVRIGRNVASIGESAFWECTSLKKVYICRDNTFPDPWVYDMTIASDAFLSCTALTDVYVPWAEDHNEHLQEIYPGHLSYVTPASEWAPINATVHYNYEE